MKHTYAGALAFILLVGAPTILLAETDGTGTAVSGSAATETTVSPRDAATGQATGKRQHQPIIIQKEIQARASTTREHLKQEIEDRRGEIKNKRDEIQNEMRQKRDTIIKKHGERIIHRLEAALERLHNIAARLDSRIVKFDEKGFDTKKAKADLAIAKTKIDAAKVKLDAAKTAIAGILSGSGTTATSTPGGILSGKIILIKEQVRLAEEALKDARKALVLVIVDLKGKSEGKKVTATTTAEVSN
jgi:DNA repair exonuclease SbcCD ATPase subunit